MGITLNTSFPGEFLDKIITKATLSNELVQNNLIHVEPNVLKKLFIGELTIGTILQHRVEQPSSNDAQGTFVYKEKALEPKDIMAYTEFNPRAFESIWRKWQPVGPMAVETWGPQAQADFINVFSSKVAEELGNQYINGICDETGSNDGMLINGIVARILADKDVNAAGAGETTYAKKFKAMLKKLPKAYRKKSNLKFITSISDADNYDEELKLNAYKNGDMTQKQSLAYNGIPVVGLGQWPEGLIVLTMADASLESNLFAGVAWQQDEDFIAIDKVSNSGEKYFLKMLMKADTNIALAEAVVICDERAVDGTYVTTANAAEDVESISTSGAVLGKAVTYTNTKSSGKVTVNGVDLAAKGDKATFYFGGTSWAVKA